MRIRKPLRYFTPSEVADLIEAFWEGNVSAWDWDNFESAVHVNPVVQTALELLWVLVRLHPPQSATEYCHKAAKPQFFAVASLLRRQLLPAAEEAERIMFRETKIPPRFAELLADQIRQTN